MTPARPSDRGGPCCAHLTIVYRTEPAGDSAHPGSVRGFWICTSCDERMRIELESREALARAAAPCLPASEAAQSLADLWRERHVDLTASVLLKVKLNALCAAFPAQPQTAEQRAAVESFREHERAHPVSLTPEQQAKLDADIVEEPPPASAEPGAALVAAAEAVIAHHGMDELRRLAEALAAHRAKPAGDGTR